MRKLLTIALILLSLFALVACTGDEPDPTVDPTVDPTLPGDTTAPVFAGVGAQSILQGTAFNPLAGVTATDNVDGSLTTSITVTGTVNINVPGTYTLTYTVTDAAGNVATATRVITVTAPTNNGQLIDFADSFVQKTRIRVWIDDENGEYMAAVIAEFNKVYPNIVVEHQHMGTVDARELLKTFGPSGNGADVFQFPHDHLALAILEDLVLSLPTATQERLALRSHPLGLQIATLSYDENAKSFNPSSPNAVERLYAVPMSIESVGLFYNTDLVASAPTTYEALLTEVLAFNSALAADGSGLTNAQKGLYGLATSSHWADSYFMQHIYSAFGFYPFGPELNNPSAVGFATAASALTWMVSSLKPAVTGVGNHDSVTGGANFENGLVPYIIAGPWNHEGYKNAGLNYKVAPMPSINGQPTRTFAGAQMAAVYKYSNNAEDAQKFVEFLSSDVAMKLMFEMKGKLPALNDDLLAEIEGLGDDELLMAMAAQLATSVPMPTIPQVQYYWGPGETMIIDVWNNGQLVSNAVATAEASYLARLGLAG
jgi:arabinogalactan oligomer/maltooligosaccharide transport system substrate-binding protein